ncbi:MAG: translation initiation factor IF-3 [Patescibacteria group bacterium]
MSKSLANNKIRAVEVRVVDESGKQLGVMSLSNAIQVAQEHGLDLVQVTKKVKPPVCRITDYGKYLYVEEKKKRQLKTKKTGELKGIRLGFNISTHDLETRAKQAEKFLARGDKIKVEVILRGRQKALSDIANEKIKEFIQILSAKTNIKIEKNLEKRGRTLIMIISK